MPVGLAKFDICWSRPSCSTLEPLKVLERSSEWTTTQVERILVDHIVFVPKCRRKVLYGQIRKELGKVLAELARHKESCIETGSLQPDHVHMVISIPPKYSVAQVVGYIKGKSAIHIARSYAGKKRNFVGEQFWARGYFVSTVGKDEQKIKECQPSTS